MSACAAAAAAAVALSAVTAAVLAAPSGWSGDPLLNLPIADRPGDQVQVKLAPTSDGGLYVSWYDNADGGYDVALQRIGDDGAAHWPHNGIIVADTGFDWVTDYDLTADADDEALLAFRDDRGGEGERITVARVAPDGTMLWGAAGLQLDGPAEFLGPPAIVSTSDDQVVVAWTHDNEIRVRRLDLAGRPLWASDVVFADPSGATQFLADAQPMPDGGVVVSWVNTLGFASPRHLWTQRLTRDGAPLWGETDTASGGRAPLVLFDAGTLQYGNFPPFRADGLGGAVFAWYETDPVLQVRVQRVRADGTFQFPPGGALTTEPDPSVERVEPAIAFDPETEDIYVFWREMYESGPLDQWIRGQHFGADGQPTWGRMGIEIVWHGAHEVTQLHAEAYSGGLPYSGVIVAYVEKLAEGDQRVWVQRYRATGDGVWPDGRIAVSSVPSAKSRLALAVSAADLPVLGWQDTRSGDEDIYLQNVNADGSLGPRDTPAQTGTPGTPATPSASVTPATPPASGTPATPPPSLTPPPISSPSPTGPSPTGTAPTATAPTATQPTAIAPTATAPTATAPTATASPAASTIHLPFASRGE